MQFPLIYLISYLQNCLHNILLSYRPINSVAHAQKLRTKN